MASSREEKWDGKDTSPSACSPADAQPISNKPEKNEPRFIRQL